MKYLLRLPLLFICICFTAAAFAQRAGSLDTTFNHNGIVYTQVAGDTVNQANAVAIQSDGKIVVAGLTANYDNYLQDFAVLRYDTNGSLDTTFNKTGYVITLLDSNYYAEFNAVVIQPNGKILAGGYEFPLKGKTSFVLMRFNSNGDFDTTFGNNGVVKDTVNGDITSIVLQTDGSSSLTPNPSCAGEGYLVIVYLYYRYFQAQVSPLHFFREG